MPAPKAPTSQFIAWRRKPPYLKIKPLLKMRKKGLPPLSLNEIRDVHARLCEIVGFYMGLHSLERQGNASITLTEQDKVLRGISLSARKLCIALQEADESKVWEKRKGWATRLRRKLDLNVLHSNVHIILSRHLRRAGISLKQFLDLLWDYPTQDELRPFFSPEMKKVLLEKLLHLVSLTKTPDEKTPRWANPNHYFLVQSLARIWCEVTGRTHRHSGDYEQKSYLFHIWLNSVLEEAGSGGLSADQVNGIAQRLEIKK